MFEVKTKFYRRTGSIGFRSILTHYCSGKIKKRKIYFNQTEVFNHPFYGDGEPFFAKIRMNTDNNFTMDVNIYIDSPADVYCNLTWFQKFILRWQFKTTWIQQTENIKWLVMAILAGVGAFLAVLTYLYRS
ncbi:hypothetical protein [Flavobacterium sp. PS2]|uniref:hypothetical protein n=1 Tax=Flavobacterium sp. PS2 TaxID=3384157 RepID=UPI00390C84BD